MDRELTLLERRSIARERLPRNGWYYVVSRTHLKETYDKLGIPSLLGEVEEYFKNHPVVSKYLSKEAIFKL